MFRSEKYFEICHCKSHNMYQILKGYWNLSKFFKIRGISCKFYNIRVSSWEFFKFKKFLYYWNQSDSKFPQVLITLLNILTDLNIVVIWMVAILFLISSSLDLLSKTLETVPNTPNYNWRDSHSHVSQFFLKILWQGPIIIIQTTKNTKPCTMLIMKERKRKTIEGIELQN